MPHFAKARRLDHPLAVGTATDNYPLSSLNASKQAEGFAVDVLDATARAAGLKLTQVQATTNQLVELFKKGELDLLQSLRPAPGSETWSDLSVHYLEQAGLFYVRKNDGRFHSPADLSNAEVALPASPSAGEKSLRDNGISARLTRIASTEEALATLNSGRHDAAFAERLTSLSLIARDNLQNLRPLGTSTPSLSTREYFAVHKGDSALLARLNEGLAQLHRTGEYDLIYTKWFGRFDPAPPTRQSISAYVAATLGLALLITLLGLIRQRALRRHLSRQSRQIAESEAILAEAQHIAQLGNWHYDLAARKLTCSPETLRILGRDKQHGPPSYYRLLMMLPRPERLLVHRAIRSALRDGIACDITVPLQTRTIKILHATARPLRGASGGITGLFGTVQDISRQKAAEEGLRAREQLLRALYDNMPTAMGVVEPAGRSFRFISANPSTARLLGLHAAALASHVLDELPIPSALIEVWTQWFRQGSAQSEILKLEHHHESSRRHYTVTLVPLGGETDSRPQLCFLVDDITEQKVIDAEIAQGRRLRAIGELVGGIAHEFNNLLTPIMLKTEMLASEWAHNSRMIDELQGISSAAKRGADLTRRLLTFGRRSDPRLEEINLVSIIKANFDLLSPTIDRRISLAMSIPEALPTLFLNPSDLHQIVLNLLLNARDTLVERLSGGTGPDWTARIIVEAAEHELARTDSNPPTHGHAPLSWICLTVRDNGMGMQPEVQERIFEPFYTTKDVGKGTGLGLATAWHLITRMGGKITVESETGRGSAFNVLLPVTAKTETAKKAPTPPETRPLKTSAKILLVEDDELVAKTVGTLLKRLGHKVTHYANGSEAWQHLSTHPAYDLLLLDLDLPGINGLEIARRARSIKYTGSILIASGRLSESESRELDLLSVDGKLQKPFTPQALNTALQVCLTGQKLHDAQA